MDKAGKAEALETYKNVFAKAGVIVVTQYSGLTVAELTDLRVKLKGQGANLKVIKNRLAKIALNGKGGESAGGHVQGPRGDRLLGRSGGGSESRGGVRQGE